MSSLQSEQKISLYYDAEQYPLRPESLISFFNIKELSSIISEIYISWGGAFPWDVDQRLRSRWSYIDQFIFDLSRAAEKSRLTLIPVIKTSFIIQFLGLKGYEYIRDSSDVKIQCKVISEIIEDMHGLGLDKNPVIFAVDVDPGTSVMEGLHLISEEYNCKIYDKPSCSESMKIEDVWTKYSSCVLDRSPLFFSFQDFISGDGQIVKYGEAVRILEQFHSVFNETPSIYREFQELRNVFSTIWSELIATNEKLIYKMNEKNVNVTVLKHTLDGIDGKLSQFEEHINLLTRKLNAYIIEEWCEIWSHAIIIQMRNYVTQIRTIPKSLVG